MTDTTADRRRARRGVTPRGAKPGAMRLVLGRELGDLWLGGRLLFLLVLFAILMSATSIMRELESATSLIPPAEMIYLTLISTVSFGILVSLIIGADAISGERERATLEPVLLAPVTPTPDRGRPSTWRPSRRGRSTLLISLPYVVFVSDGHDILGTAYFWTIITGTLLAISFAGFGILVSIWSRSNRTSLLREPLCLRHRPHPDTLAGRGAEGRPRLRHPAAQPDAGDELLPREDHRQQPDPRASTPDYLVANILTAIVARACSCSTLHRASSSRAGRHS